MDLTLCNAWLLYVLEPNQTHPGVKFLDLYQFKRNVSECWIKQNVTEDHPKRRPVRSALQVPRKLRFDGKGHLPHCFSEHDGRSHCAHCKRFTNMYCLKCEVHLCCHYERNCWISYHTEDENEIVSLPVWLSTHEDVTQIESEVDDLESDVDDLDSEPHDTKSDFADPEYSEEI